MKKTVLSSRAQPFLATIWHSVAVKYRRIYLTLFMLWVLLPNTFALNMIPVDDGELHRDDTGLHDLHRSEKMVSINVKGQARTTELPKQQTHLHAGYGHDPMKDSSNDAHRKTSLSFVSILFETYSNQSNAIFISDLKTLITNIRLGAMLYDNQPKDAHMHDEHHIHDEHHRHAADIHGHAMNNQDERNRDHDAHVHGDGDDGGAVSGNSEQQNQNNRHRENLEDLENHHYHTYHHGTDDDKHDTHKDKTHAEDDDTHEANGDKAHHHDKDSENQEAPGLDHGENDETYKAHIEESRHHDDDNHDYGDDHTDKKVNDKHNKKDDNRHQLSHPRHHDHHHRHHGGDHQTNNHDTDNSKHSASDGEKNSLEKHDDDEYADHSAEHGHVHSNSDGQQRVNGSHNNDDQDDNTDDDDDLITSKDMTTSKPLRNQADERKDRKSKSKSQKKNRNKKRKNKLHDSEKKDKVNKHKSQKILLQRQTRHIAPEISHSGEQGEIIRDSGDISVYDRSDMGTRTNKCLSLSEVMALFNYSRKESLTKSEFLNLCPVLIRQLESGDCDVTHNHIHQTRDAKSWSFSTIPGKVWGFSILAVTIISLVGLLGVAIIPIMHKVFYNHLIQFLVALAVGALTGDALLHLLPHAISGGHGDEENEHAHGDGSDEGGHNMGHGLWQGFAALLAIYFFFMVERMIIIITRVKDKRKSKKLHKAYKSVEWPSNPSPGEESPGHGETDALRQHKHHIDDDGDDCETANYIEHQNKPDQSHNGTPDSEPQPSHGHTHLPLPASVAAIAWMVIIGDGIHNFSDGLAIGAAFSDSIAGGFGTSLAVFCHELPHEIGDFAVLLRAGMSVKQAVVYNCVSSVLCFIGMLIGVALGNVNSSTVWIFAAVGGMFLYIALVDMLPEMTSANAKHVDNPFLHLLLQMLGMLLGAGIMFVIALYEHDLGSTFDV